MLLRPKKLSTKPNYPTPHKLNCTLSTEGKELTCFAFTWNFKEHLSKSIHSILFAIYIYQIMFSHIYMFSCTYYFYYHHYFSILACGNINYKLRNPLLPDSGQLCIVQIKVHAQKLQYPCS